MKAIVKLKNFENEYETSVFAHDWVALEDKAHEIDDIVNEGLPLFDRYKTVSIDYYDNDNDLFDIYLKKKIK
jgi:hypothetical protein